MVNKIIRVFPRRTSYTPTDPYAFVGDPPFDSWRPKADIVHISVTFTWDIDEAERLRYAWWQYYPHVAIGGPALNSDIARPFIAGQYIKQGVTFTSRGCNNHCSHCLVPEREGRLRVLDIMPGHIIQDNNLLQCPRDHIGYVFSMLRSQKRAITFSGGLQSSLVNDYIVEQLQTIPIKELFLACDTKEAIKPLRKATQKLSALDRNKLRCYVMIGKDETISEAEDRLEQVWEAGCLPFSQLYQPPDKYIEYPLEWTKLNWKWSRPAAMKAIHKEATQ